MKEEQLFDECLPSFDLKSSGIFAGICTKESFALFPGIAVEGLDVQIDLIDKELQLDKDLKLDK